MIHFSWKRKYELDGRHLDFGGTVPDWVARRVRSYARIHYPEQVQPTLLFPAQPELTPEIPPTWCEGSDVFHTIEKCNRLRAIPRNRRIKANKEPIGLRLCHNCEDIIRTKRSG